jgi:GT2 family glycosyltransferase
LKLVISIVVYSPDLKILEKTLDSLVIACKYCFSRFDLITKIDLINNNPQSDFAQSFLRALRKIKRHHFLKVSILNSKINGGYGYGNNKSINRNFDSDFHLVLNPDVILDKDSLKNAISYMTNNRDIGLITPNVTGMDGAFHYTCKKNPTLFIMFIRCIPGLKFLFSRINNEYEMRSKNYNKVIKSIQFPTGCFMFFRSSILREIGGFDERYFLHYEDADIGRKLSEISRCDYLPNVRIKHLWSRATHKNFLMRLITIQSGIKYWRKWGGFF